ncbi:hypothetical protein CERSUDRAFT_100458 [Gelatoporia subvermispora B]|uniref:DUF6533 domain-containing protein n=1 Tax=Ceriporiopsis subvermispora (strain B) TaxID=914234 RepID=M2P7Z2_CERS8|nr:hypothetical protein CERSUDRAFT_100458 [Gelatoporia subvermispora B]
MSQIAMAPIYAANFMTSTASAGLVIYDIITTLSDEVHYIWRRQFSSVTLLFWLNRSALLLWAAAALYLSFGSAAASTVDSATTGDPLLLSCSFAEDLLSVSEMLINFVQAVFMSVRVYALSGGQLRMTVVLFIFGLTGILSSSTIVGRPQAAVDVPGLAFRVCPLLPLIPETFNGYKTGELGAASLLLP